MRYRSLLLLLICMAISSAIARHAGAAASADGESCFLAEKSDVICDPKTYRPSASGTINIPGGADPAPGPEVYNPSSNLFYIPPRTSYGASSSTNGSNTSTGDAVDTSGTCQGENAYESFKSHLRAREGCPSKVYVDKAANPANCPKPPGNCATAGCGHLVTSAEASTLTVGKELSKDEIEALLEKDASRYWSSAQADAKAANVCATCFISALGSANFQLGSFKTKFPTAYGMIRAGNYEGAANALNGTPWMKQTPTRVRDLQAALRAIPTAGNTCGGGATGGGAAP